MRHSRQGYNFFSKGFKEVLLCKDPHSIEKGGKMGRWMGPEEESRGGEEEDKKER